MNEDKDYHLLNQKLRKVFSDRIFYTRLYVINELSDLKGYVPLINRLMQNQDDIGFIFKEYDSSISEEDVSEITRLFREYIYIVADLVKFIKLGDVIQQTEISVRWHMNAVEIAETIGNILSSCDIDKLRDVLFEHIMLTQEEIMTYFYQLYDQSIKKFDEVVGQILVMADYLSDCLFSQIDIKANNVDSKVGLMENKVGLMENKVGLMENKVGLMENKVDQVDSIENVDNKVGNNPYLDS